ncbi:hypothetical protein EDB86DRAFT_1373838 [Lactarius hatsudake]|nr:hypothetical protein EDB86DRAFT_1373838 [Lactarius hatsudake]
MSNPASRFIRSAASKSRGIVGRIGPIEQVLQLPRMFRLRCNGIHLPMRVSVIANLKIGLRKEANLGTLECVDDDTFADVQNPTTPNAMFNPEVEMHWCYQRRIGVTPWSGRDALRSWGGGALGVPGFTSETRSIWELGRRKVHGARRHALISLSTDAITPLPTLRQCAPSCTFVLPLPRGHLRDSGTSWITKKATSHVSESIQPGAIVIVSRGGSRAERVSTSTSLCFSAELEVRQSRDAWVFLGFNTGVI